MHILRFLAGLGLDSRVLVVAILAGAEFWIWWICPYSARLTLVPPRAMEPGYASSLVGFTDDSATLVSTDSTGVLRAWNIATGTERFGVLEGEIARFSPRNKLLAIESESRVSILDIETGANQVQLPIEEDSNLVQFDFSPDGELLVTRDQSGILRLWHMPSGDLWNTLPITSKAVGAPVNEPPYRFSDDAALLLIQLDESRIAVWDIKAGVERLRVESISAPALSRDGRSLALRRGQDVVVYDVSAGTIRGTLRDDTWGSVRRLQFGPASDTLVIESERGLEIWDPRALRLMAVLEGGGWLDQVRLPVILGGRLERSAFSSSGRFLLEGRDGEKRVWDIYAQPPREVFRVFPHEVQGCRGTFGSGVGHDTGDRNRLVSVTRTRNVPIIGTVGINRWLISPNEKYAVWVVLYGFRENRVGLYVDKLAKRVTKDETIAVDVHLFDMPSERLVASLEDAYEPVFSPDGRFLATVSLDGTIKIWDLPPAKATIWLFGPPLLLVAYFAIRHRRCLLGRRFRTNRGRELRC